MKENNIGQPLSTDEGAALNDGMDLKAALADTFFDKFVKYGILEFDLDRKTVWYTEKGKLLASYNASKSKTLEDVLEFHYRFESIHPFQDGNGRVGRLILFKECLRNHLVPFIIDDTLKMFYYRGLHEWESERGYLTDTCLTAQDRFKKYLDYFRIPYEKE